MTILRDILDVKDSVGSFKDSSTDSLKSNAHNSIAKEAAPGVFQFPALVSPTLSLEETSMIAKALERNYVSFITIITSIDSVTDEKSIKQYLSRIHQNTDTTRNTSVSLGSIRESSMFSIPKIDSGLLTKLKESEENLIGIMKSINIDNLKSSNTDEKMFDDEDDVIVNYDDLEENEQCNVNNVIKEKCLKENFKIFKYNKNSGINSIVLLREDTSDTIQILMIRNLQDNSLRLVEGVTVATGNLGIDSSEKNILNESINSLKTYVPDLNMNILNDATINNNNYNIIGRGPIKEKYRNIIHERSIANELQNDTDFGGPVTVNNPRETVVEKDVLRDNDVKKANELMPTLLHLKTFFKDSNDSLNAVDYMIGVKVVIHTVNSNVMIDNLVKGLKRGKAFFNVMKLTTGEMSFFKDFVFAVSRIKDDVTSKFKGNPWFNSLIRRRKYSRILKTFNLKTQLVPNTTIVISMDEVEQIKIEHNIDVMNVDTVYEIMNQLFLLGFVVVDSSIQTAHFLFDGQRHFQEYSYNALERENSNSAKEVQNIMKVLGRM